VANETPIRTNAAIADPKGTNVLVTLGGILAWRAVRVSSVVHSREPVSLCTASRHEIAYREDLVVSF